MLPDSTSFLDLVTTPGLIAVDKTDFVEILDSEPRYWYRFLRPYRWGKSTFLNMLADYYDKSQVNSFEDRFGQLYIGKNPTPCHNTLLVLLFDLSTISVSCSDEEMERQFNSTINQSLTRFLIQNARFLDNPDPASVIKDDGSASLKSVLELAMWAKQPLFVGVDNYDNPLHSYIVSGHLAPHENYQKLVLFFQSRFFDLVEKAYHHGMIQKCWFTGVFPVFSGETTGITSLTQSIPLGNICGFTSDEVEVITTSYLARTHTGNYLHQVLWTLENESGGHTFSPWGSHLFNPGRVNAHLKAVRSGGVIPPDEDKGICDIQETLNGITAEGDFTVDYLFTLLRARLIGASASQDETLEPCLGEESVFSLPPDSYRILQYLGAVGLDWFEPHYMQAPNTLVRRLVAQRIRDFVMASYVGFTKKLKDVNHRVFNGEDPLALVDLLKDLLQARAAFSAFDVPEGALMAFVHTFLTHEDRYIPDLCLINDPTYSPSSLRFRTVDFILPARNPPSASVASLVMVTSVSLDPCPFEDTYSEPSPWPFFDLEEPPKMTWQAVLEASDEQLLQTPYHAYDDRTSQFSYSSPLPTIKEKLTIVLESHMKEIKAGSTDGSQPGIFDARIHCGEGCDRLDGYVLLCIGARVLMWKAASQETRLAFWKSPGAATN
ncbi:hypothetical protein Hypma_008674 [Hypsizygus marmoreus]|uniref:AAA-ATPase-like domain-containing protein n=1 Tax=Hypsizygus marmoreus TaxID=39966 RepID=A0A369JXP2_HYPMA|nr:hypothetical protein Hypma_008674 [Hypsizygus marmoreus]